jgi:hypothetical protein
MSPDRLPLCTHFCECPRHQYIVDWLSLRVILWTDEAYFKREDVFNYYNSHFWVRNNLQVRLSVGILAGIVGDIVVDYNLIPYRLTAQQ